MWFNNFTSVAELQQPYSSAPIVINQFGAVNQKATITLTPSTDVSITANNLTVADQQTGEGHHATLTYSQVANSALMINTAPNSPVAAKIGLTTAPNQNPVLNQVPVKTEWVSDNDSFYYGGPAPANATTVVQNAWAKVLSTQQVVVGSVAANITVAITGNNFRPLDRAISCLFDGVSVALTATGSTTADADTTYHPGTVVADSLGNFTATFVVPDGTLDGVHTVECVAHTSGSLTAISSLASATYSAGSYVENISLYVTLATPPKGVPCYYVPAFVLTEVLGVGVPDSAVLNSVGGPVAYTIAYAIAQCVNASLAVTSDLLVAAVTAMYQYTTVGHAVLANGFGVIDAIVDACNTSSTNVQANASAMLAASLWASIALKNYATCYLDPLGQTFTPAQDGFITQIGLYFNTKPSSGNNVEVDIVETTAGIPTENILGSAVVVPASISTSAETLFAFTKPVFLTGGTEYAFVVKTQDTTASLWSAVLGQKDPTYELILQNPSAALLNSPNASTWQLLAGQDLKFNIYSAVFSGTQGVLNYGLTTFDQDSSIISLNVPFANPSAQTSVQFQWSLNGTEWQSFAPLVELDLQTAASGVYLRLLMNGSSSECPTVSNSNELQYHIYQASGEYLSRQFGLPSAEAEFCEIYAETSIPGNTTLTFSFSPDGGTTFYTLSEVVADAVQLDNIYTRRHFEVDQTVDDLFQNCIPRIQLASTVNYVSPAIRNVQVIIR